MKINKLIAKGLSIGLLLNSLLILSYANIEIPNRYQTLEGEYITIDDSIEGNLEEIEIFGNTIQDPDNLEDIQSVGDLYVDEDGNPILDKQGRKQYKIDVFSSKSIETDCKKVYEWEEGSIRANGNLHDLEDRIRTKDYIDIGNSKYIHLKFNTDLDNSKVSISINMYNKNKEPLGDFNWDYGNLDKGFSLEHGTRYIKIKIYGGENSRIIPNNLLDCKLYSEDYQNRHKETFILPAQLQKVGNIADRLYWDRSKGRYIIEKNIKEIVLNGLEDDWIKSYDWVNLEGQNTVSFQKPIPGIIFNREENLKILATKFKGLKVFSGSTEITEDREWIRPYSSTSENVGIRILKSKLTGEEVDDFKLWLRNNPVTVYYQLRNPQIIETSITSKLKIPTYNGKTHIYVDSQNSINPTLKVIVDRLPQIAKNSVEEAKINSSINSISLARMYTNMLPESLYKDQLQEQLSQIFSSDIVLDKKSVTSNLDLYIKCENILQMSLSTNNITFEDFSGVEDMTKENAVQISINSSLPYSLNAYLPTEIQNSDKSVAMNKDILNIKENSETTYQTFLNTTDKIVLKDNNQAGNDLIHNIDIKLKGGIAHQKDVYKTTIKFEAEQK